MKSGVMISKRFLVARDADVSMDSTLLTGRFVSCKSSFQGSTTCSSSIKNNNTTALNCETRGTYTLIVGFLLLYARTCLGDVKKYQNASIVARWDGSFPP
jgi:hypothetical protein